MEQEEKVVKVSISMPKGQYENLKRIAEEESRSISAQIQYILKKAGIGTGTETEQGQES